MGLVDSCKHLGAEGWRYYYSALKQGDAVDGGEILPMSFVFGVRLWPIVLVCLDEMEKFSVVVVADA